jgi:hypothetical protein
MCELAFRISGSVLYRIVILFPASRRAGTLIYIKLYVSVPSDMADPPCSSSVDSRCQY